MGQFTGQNIIVTGGTRGIGAAISSAFLAEGATVIATFCNNIKAADNFKQSCGELGERLHLEQFDVSSFTATSSFFSRFAEKFGSLHALVNNSGIRRDAMVAMMEKEEWSKVLSTNLDGTYYMCRGAVPLMMSGRYGRIINIGSIGGKMGLPGQANYAASKAGQVALAKSLSREVAKKKITVNTVLPGFIETELLSDLPDDLVAQYKKDIPMKRFGKVEEVASAVLFLASQSASYITGSTLEISGGL
jgi:3-oxoacyl-[acyl-carrier protein] reductase